MINLVYEPQTHADPKSPIIFHYDVESQIMPHLHEGIEILCFTHGSARVCAGETQVMAKKNDIVIINSSDIHSISAESGKAKYYCLIVDKDFCEYFDIYIDKIIFKNHISDEEINKKFFKIKNEIEIKNIYFKTAVKAEVLSLLTYLCRNYALTSFKVNMQSNKIEMVKKTIKYIQLNYNKNIMVNDIAREVGFSKYYFCHVFKEVTGFTVVSYINFLRCRNAESLLRCGIYNVSEVAQMCGFENLSYFTKTYKKYIGITPSSQK